MRESDRTSRKKRAVQVDNPDCGAAGADVGDQHGEPVIQGDLRGTASARSFDGLALADPAFFDELLDDRGDGGVLQAGVADEIDAGNGLMSADELENDVAVDPAARMGEMRLKSRMRKEREVV